MFTIEWDGTKPWPIAEMMELRRQHDTDTSFALLTNWLHPYGDDATVYVFEMVDEA